MTTLDDASRSFARYSYSRIVIFQVKRCLMPLIAALLLIFTGIVSAALVSYNYSTPMQSDCKSGADVEPCFIRGMFDIDSDFFGLPVDNPPVNVMFELVRNDGVIIDSFLGIPNRPSSTETTATGQIIDFGLTHFEFGVLNLLLFDTQAIWSAEGVIGEFGHRYELFDSNDILITPKVIPIPAAAWLFGTALIGLVGFSRRRKAA